MNFKTINDLNNTINVNLYKIPKKIDLVVGVPRSGLFVANIIALYLNLPLADLDSFLNKKMFSCGKTRKKDNWISKITKETNALIVEDSSISGNSLYELKEKLKKVKCSVTILTVYVTDGTKDIPDIYFEICNPPRMFEWNYLHHKNLAKACFDIDGVLCVDPTAEQNDDGERYIQFIRNAPLRVAPSFKIGYLVTSRLEKYREDTEYWLKKNNIQYDHLIMMQFKTKEERIKSGSHGKFKGEEYSNFTETNLFVESELRQAKEIAEISGKVVFCTENQSVIYIPKVIDIDKNNQVVDDKLNNNYFKNKFKSVIKKNVPTPIIRFIKKLLRMT